MNAPLILSVASPPPVCALDFKQLHSMLHNCTQSMLPSIPPHGSVDSTASLWFLPRTLKSSATFPQTLFWCLLTAKLESLEESYEQHQQYIVTAYGQVVAVASTSPTATASNAAVFVTLEDLMSRIDQLHECIVLSMSGLSLLLRTVDLYYGSSFRPSSSSSSSSFPIHIHDLYLTQLQETYRFPSLCKLHMDIPHLHQQTTHAQSIIGNIYHHIKVILHNRSSRNVSGTPPPSSSPFSLPLHAMQVDRPVLPPGVGSISASSVHSQAHAPTPGVESGSAASPFASADSSASALRDRGCACSSSCSCTCSSAGRCSQACSNTKQTHVYAQNSISASPPTMSTTAATTTSSASATNNGTTADLLSMSPQSPYPSSFAPTSTPSSTSSYPTDTLSPSTFLSIGMLRICSAFCPPICSCEQETCQCHYATMAPEEHKETDRLTQVPADHDTVDDDYNQTEQQQEPQHRQSSNDNVSHAASSQSNSVDAAAEVLVNCLSQQSSAVNSTVNELPLRSAALASVGAPSVKSTFTSISPPSALATDSHPIERQLQTQVQQAETKANEASSTMLRADTSTSPGATDVTLNASHTTSSRVDLQVVDMFSHEPATQARLMTCHQCKSSRAENQVVGCTNQADVFKKCMLKYCFSCLLKHYRVALCDVDKTKFVCFRCLGRCTCALCRRARTSRGGWSGSLGIALASTSLASTHTAHHSSHPHSHSHPMPYFPQHKHSVLQTTWTTNQMLPPSTSFPSSVTRSSASISSIFSGTGSCHYCKVKKLLFRLATCGKGDIQRHIANSAEMGIESSTYHITSTGTVNILKRKVCHKHFCDTCLFKHFAVTLQQIHQQQLVSNSWLCPACEGSCRCPACSRKKSKPTSSGTLPTSTFHNFDQQRQQPISDLNIMSSQS